MARGVNCIHLVGRLGKDPDVTYTPSGTAVAKFSLAVNGRRKDAAGNWQDDTQWFNIVAFGKTAETAGQYLSKGRQVYIEGRVENRSYEKNGETKYISEVVVTSLLLLGGKDGEERPAPRPAPADGEEEMPF